MSVRSMLEEAASRLGLPGIAGFGLLLFSAGLYQSAIAPRAAEVHALQERAASLPVAASAPDAAGDPLAGFYAFFPLEATLPQCLQRVYRIAEREGLEIPKGEYRLVRAPGVPLAAYQAVFPVRGSYAQLRRFVAGVLNDLPFASLDHLRLEKQKTADTAVDSQIRLTFYLRTG